MKSPKNLTGSLLVAALGLSKRYQRKAVDLAKIRSEGKLEGTSHEF